VDLTETVHRLEAYIALLHTFVDNVSCLKHYASSAATRSLIALMPDMYTPFSLMCLAEGGGGVSSQAETALCVQQSSLMDPKTMTQLCFDWTCPQYSSVNFQGLQGADMELCMVSEMQLTGALVLSDLCPPGRHEQGWP